MSIPTSSPQEDASVEVCRSCGCQEPCQTLDCKDEELLAHEQGDNYNAEPEDVTLQQCGGCMNALYCSRQCQKQQWEDHRQECVAQGSLLLANAILQGDKKTVKRFARHKGCKSHLNHCAVNGSGPSWFQCLRLQKLDLLKIILNGGNVDLETTDGDNRTALVLCCKIKPDVWGTTPVLPFVKMLLNAGANLNHKDDQGRTALWWAALWACTRQDGSVELVETLLKSGADSEIVYVYPTAMTRFSLLQSACQPPAGREALEREGPGSLERRLAVATVLVQQGANVNANFGFYEATPLLMVAGREIVHPTDVPMLELLISAGANVNARENSIGRTALMIAATISKKRGRTDIIEALLKAGADPNAETESTDARVAGKTPMIAAIDWVYKPAVEVMLACGRVDFTLGGPTSNSLWSFVNFRLKTLKQQRSVSRVHQQEYFEMVQISRIIRTYMDEHGISS